LYEAGKQTHEIAAALGTCKSGTRRIRQKLRERGTLEPLKGKPGPRGGLTEELAAKIKSVLAAEPGLTRQQLRDRLELDVDVRTIGRWLASLGMVLKKSRFAPASRTGPMLPSDASPGQSY
jgi:transposase